MVSKVQLLMGPKSINRPRPKRRTMFICKKGVWPCPPGEITFHISYADLSNDTDLKAGEN